MEGNAEPTADLVGKVDMMIRQLFDIVYVNEETVVECTVEGVVAAAVVVVGVGMQGVLDAAEEVEKAAGKGKGKGAAVVAETPVASPPPAPPAAETVWQQKTRLIQQQIETTTATIAAAESNLLRTYSFLKAPPPHVKGLVVNFMLSCGAFQYTKGRPNPTLHTPCFSRDAITVQEARQICLADPKLCGFSFSGPVVPSFPPKKTVFYEVSTSTPLCYSDIGEFPEEGGGGGGEKNGEEEEEDTVLEPAVVREVEYHTYTAYPSIAGEWALLEGNHLEEYRTNSRVRLMQAGSRIWGMQTRPGRAAQYFVRGNVTQDGAITLTIADATIEEDAHLAECFSADNFYSLSGKLSQVEGLAVIREFSGVCTRVKDIQGGSSDWEFRMERDLYGGYTTQQEVAPVAVTHVSELHENWPGIVSVRFSVSPPISTTMHKEPAAEREDFRRVFLSVDLQVIYGIDAWMSGTTQMRIEKCPAVLDGRLLDLPRIAGVKPKEQKEEGGIAPRPPQGNSGKKSKKKVPQAALSDADLQVVSKMNCTMHYMVNPRALPPDALQPPHELSLSQNCPAWKAKTLGDSGGSGGKSLKTRKSLRMETALPKESDSCPAGDAIFAAAPSEIIFPTPFSVGLTYDLGFTLTNKDKVSRRLNVQQPDHPVFKIKLLTAMPEGGLLAPGMSVKYSIKFSPQTLETFESKVIVATEWSNFFIPIIAARERPLLTINGQNSPSNVAIHNDDCLLGDTLRTVLTLRNDGGWASFAVVPKDEELRKILCIEPEQISLGRNESADVTISIVPTAVGDASVILHIDSDEGSAHSSVSISMNSVYPTLIVPAADDAGRTEDIEFEFGDTSLLAEEVKGFSIINEAAVGVSVHAGLHVVNVFGETVLKTFTISRCTEKGEEAVVPNEADNVLTIPARSTLNLKLRFSPTMQGAFEGRLVFALCNIPEPQSDAHPFWKKDVALGEGVGYFITSLLLTGLGSKIPLKITPNRVECQSDVVAQYPNTRVITISNQGTRAVSFEVNPDKTAFADEITGVALHFAPRKGTIPRQGSVQVTATYTPLTVGEFYKKVEVLCDNKMAQSLFFEIMGQAGCPHLRTDVTTLDYTADGIISTAQHGGRGVDQKITITNTSKIPLAYHVYSYWDMISLEQEDREAHPVQFHVDPDVDIIQPSEQRVVCVTFFPPAEPGEVKDCINVTSAPILPQHGALVDNLTTADIFEVTSRQDIGLLDACAVLLGCLPPVADTLMTVLKAEPSVVLHHIKLVNASRKGLDLLTSNPSNALTGSSQSHSGFLHSTLVARIVESEALMGRLEASLRMSTSPPECVLLCWAKLASAFLKCLQISKKRIAIAAEIQTIKCHIVPSQVVLQNAFKNVPQYVNIELRNVCAVDGTFRWAIVENEGSTQATAIAEPSSGYIPGGTTVVCKLGITQLSSEPIDLILPCVLKNIPVNGSDDDDGKQLLLGVHITSLHETQNVAFSLDHSDTPTPIEEFCRSIVNDMVSSVVKEESSLLVPAINTKVNIFEVHKSDLTLKHIQGGEAAYTLNVEKFPSDTYNLESAKALLAHTRNTGMDVSTYTQNTQNSTLTFSDITLSMSGSKGKKMKSKKLTLSANALQFSSKDGRKHALDKMLVKQGRQQSYEYLSKGNGFAIEIPQSHGVLSRTGASEVCIPLELHSDLAGLYEDTIHLEFSDPAIKPVRIPITCTVTGQLVSLSEDTPGLFFPLGSPPVLQFPVNLASPTLSRTKVFKIDNPGRVDTEVSWSVILNGNNCEVSIDEDGVAVKEAASTVSAAFEVHITPESCVIQAGGAKTFQAVVVMREAGQFRANLTCSCRTAKTAANLQYLRSSVQGKGDSAETVLAHRWEQEAKYAAPVHLDLQSAAVSNGLTCDPSLLHMLCRGAPAPYSPKKDGFCKTLRLTNKVAAAQDFRVHCGAPFVLSGYALHTSGVRSLVSNTGDDSGMTLFQLKNAESLDLYIELPWGESVAQRYRQGESSMLNGTRPDLLTMKGSMVAGDAVVTAAASQHKRRGRVQTQDVVRVESDITVTFANGETQSVPVLAVVHYPAVKCEPSAVIFGEREEDRKTEWCKRIVCFVFREDIRLGHS